MWPHIKNDNTNFPIAAIILILCRYTNHKLPKNHIQWQTKASFYISISLIISFPVCRYFKLKNYISKVSPFISGQIVCLSLLLGLPFDWWCNLFQAEKWVKRVSYYSPQTIVSYYKRSLRVKLCVGLIRNVRACIHSFED